jgi:hypothetical protein
MVEGIQQYKPKPTIETIAPKIIQTPVNHEAKAMPIPNPQHPTITNQLGNAKTRRSLR